MQMRLGLSGLLATALIGISTATAVASVPDYINAAVADPSRPADDRLVDADRKPAKVLAYAKVHPGEIVAEYLPGGGYYTRMLSDIVGPKGKVYALETTTWGEKNVDSTKAVLNESGHQNVTLDLAPLGTFDLPEKVDLFWTTLNYHDLHIPKYANVDMAAFNRLVYASLKSGGIYLIVDHQAAPGTAATSAPTLHRIEDRTVIDEVTAAGFRLISHSNMLRNSADDHSKEVFDPAIHMKTDQFILTFRKP